MKKHLLFVLAVFFGLTVSTLSILNYQSRSSAKEKSDEAGNTGKTSFYYESIKFKDAASGVNNILAAAKYSAESVKADTSAAPVKKKAPAASKKPASVKTTPRELASRGSALKSSKYGELLDWWTQARNIFKIGSVALITDVKTGRTFKIKRTMGANHADCEALTLNDTNIIKSIWGGFTWNVRPVIVSVNGRRIAASMAAMPHAGVDSAPAFAVVNNRSVGYGTGKNLDTIKGNGMNGHFDVHFLNSTRHKDGKIDTRHQAAVLMAAGR